MNGDGGSLKKCTSAASKFRFADWLWNPFRGLVAQDVRVYDYKNRANTLALVSEISLDINYAAFFHRQPFLNAVDIRNAQIWLPFNGGEKQGTPTTAEKLSGSRLLSAGADLRQPGGRRSGRNAYFRNRSADQTG